MTNAEIAEKTKKTVTESLFELMKIKDFDAVTMTEIAEKSGYGRATVYRYFQTKEEMLKYYFAGNQTMFSDIGLLKLESEDDYYEVIFKVFSAVKNRKEDIKLFMKANIESLYLDWLNKAMVENFRQNNYSESEYAAYYFAGSLFNVSMQWVRNDCDISVKRLSDIYFDKLFVSLKK